MNREEWEIELESRKMLQDNMVTDMRKNRFIEEIKNGLGEEILKEPNRKIKKQTIIDKIKKIFSK